MKIFGMFIPFLFVPYIRLSKFTWPETMLLDVILYYRFNTSSIQWFTKKRKDIEFNFYLIFLFIRTGMVMTTVEINKTLENMQIEDPNIYRLVCVLGYKNIKRKEKPDCINKELYDEHRDHVTSMLDCVLRKSVNDIDDDDLWILWAADAMTNDDNNSYRKKWISVSKRKMKLWKHVYNSHIALVDLYTVMSDEYRKMDLSSTGNNDRLRKMIGLLSLDNEKSPNKQFHL